MTPEQIHLLRRSFSVVEANAAVAGLVFYQRLFERDPSLRPLFKTDIESQSEKLIEMLGIAVNFSPRDEGLAASLAELGARHAGYGTRDEHYDTVGRAMLDMLESVIGSDFTAETREAWVAFYGFCADAMKQGAAEASEMEFAVGPAL